MKCSSCERSHDGGEWPDDDDEWCQAIKKPNHVPYALCPRCCLCGGNKECTAFQVLLISLFD